MKNDSEIIQQAKTHLHASSQRLRPEITQALRRARSKAVAQAVDSVSIPWYFRWQRIGSTALVCTLLVSVWVFKPDVPASAPMPMDAFHDLDIISSQEPLEFYEEIEFYEWMVASNDEI